jgi:hypothetical protein
MLNEQMNMTKGDKHQLDLILDSAKTSFENTKLISSTKNVLKAA